MDITALLSDLCLVVVGAFIAFLLFLPILTRALKAVIPAMVPQIMQQVGGNIPKVQWKDAIGLGIVEFIRQGGVQHLMQQWLGMKPPQEPPGGQ